jgi:flagellar FliL protein
MATTATDTAAIAADTAPAKKKGKLKLILLIVGVLMVLGGGGVAAYQYFMPHSHAPKAPAPPPPPVFFALDAFTVNLAPADDSGDGNDRYLHVGLTLQLDNAKTQEELVSHMPEVRSRILLLLSSKRPQDLNTTDGKHKLALEIAHAIAEPFKPETEKHTVNDVLFTEFVVQ